jgi:hypothetical protein
LTEQGKTMSLIYLRRRCRVVWFGNPFVSLKGFTIQVSTLLNAPGGDPIMNHGSSFMYDDQQPDLAIGYGNVGIEEFGDGNVMAGAGPITVEGQDSRNYKVWFQAMNNRMLAEDEEITVLARWHVSAVV